MPKPPKPRYPTRRHAPPVRTAVKLNVQEKKLTDLKAHPRNPRIHPEKGTPEYETLRASLRHDYFDPIVWNLRNGMLVSGHLRTKVLLDMGVLTADVIVVDYDEKTHLARMLASNHGAGRDNCDARKGILEELSGMKGFDISLSGFSSPELEDLGVLFPGGEETGGKSGENTPPGAFREFGGEGGVETQFKCPKCSFAWSGKPK